VVYLKEINQFLCFDPTFKYAEYVIFGSSISPRLRGDMSESQPLKDRKTEELETHSLIENTVTIGVKPMS
jgi:hypothetical protein